MSKHQTEPSTAEPTTDDRPGNVASEPSHESAQHISRRRSNLAGQINRFSQIYWSHKRISIPATVLVLFILAGVIPYSRYAILGLFMRQDITVTVVDSRVSAAISKATVSIDGHNATTDASGVARIRSHVGYKTLIVTKQYYTMFNYSQLVALSASHNHITVRLVALGRLVPVTVTNKITGKPIAGATVRALSIESTTGADGVATIVLPATATTETATISASGYNTLSGSLAVTDQTVAANAFAIVPAGKVYFLSKLSGNIDVVKTNLDGTDRQTVLPGTGNEDVRNTVLLASRDWKYLALLSIRTSNGQPQLNLIDTSNDQLTNIDEGDATFNPIGWDGDLFLYSVVRNSVAKGQPNRESIKSFDAKSLKLTVIDSTDGSKDVGQNPCTFYETYATTNIVGQKLVFSKNWLGLCGNYFYASYDLTTTQNTVWVVNPDGSDKQNLIHVNATDTRIASTTSYGPQSLLLETNQFRDNITSYFAVDSSGNLSSSTAEAYDSTFTAPNTYLLAPSGTQTFWSESRDGKNSLFIGDTNGANGKQIAELSDYSPYGWFTDSYLLVSKNASELYIMPATGGNAIKITDYNKPYYAFNGYGGGYGGL